MSTFEEGLTGGIQIERDGVLVEKSIDSDVRVLGIDARSLAARGNKFIADGVFDPERQKVQAGEGTTARADLDLDRLRRRKPIRPGERVRRAVDVVF